MTHDTKEVPQMSAYRHTAKAIRAGHPANRIFVQVGTDEDGDVVAWKCEEQTNASVKCPWDWNNPMTLSRAMATAPRGRAANGSMPTAIFKPDSFYRKMKRT